MYVKDGAAFPVQVYLFYLSAMQMLNYIKSIDILPPLAVTLPPSQTVPELPGDPSNPCFQAEYLPPPPSVGVPPNDPCVEYVRGIDADTIAIKLVTGSKMPLALMSVCGNYGKNNYCSGSPLKTIPTPGFWSEESYQYFNDANEAKNMENGEMIVLASRAKLRVITSPDTLISCPAVQYTQLECYGFIQFNANNKDLGAEISK